MMSKQAKKPPTTQKMLFKDAKKIISDLDGAILFLATVPSHPIRQQLGLTGGAHYWTAALCFCLANLGHHQERAHHFCASCQGGPLLEAAGLDCSQCSGVGRDTDPKSAGPPHDTNGRKTGGHHKYVRQG